MARNSRDWTSPRSKLSSHWRIGPCHHPRVRLYVHDGPCSSGVGCCGQFPCRLATPLLVSALGHDAVVCGTRKPCATCSTGSAPPRLLRLAWRPPNIRTERGMKSRKSADASSLVPLKSSDYP